jgi:phage gpG-like protein
MLQLNFSIEGEKQVSRRFNQIPDDIGDFKEPLRRIGAELKSAVDTNFSSRGSLFGEPWKPRARNYPWPLLEKTGTMRNSFTDRLGPGYVEIMNTSDYFKYHQSNKPRSSGLPRRVMLKIDQIRKTFIVKEFQRHLGKAATGK